MRSSPSSIRQAARWIFSTLLGGDGIENNLPQNLNGGLGVDAAGNIHVTGLTNSSNFPTTAGAHDTTFNGGASLIADGFYTKLSPTGALLYSTYFGGTDEEIPSGLAVDAANNVYIVGQTTSNTAEGFSTPNGVRTLFGSIRDGFLLKFNASGVLTYGTYVGGPNGQNFAYDVAVVATNRVAVVGATVRGGELPDDGRRVPDWLRRRIRRRRRLPPRVRHLGHRRRRAAVRNLLRRDEQRGVLRGGGRPQREDLRQWIHAVSRARDRAWPPVAGSRRARAATRWSRSSTRPSPAHRVGCTPSALRPLTPAWVTSRPTTSPSMPRAAPGSWACTTARHSPSSTPSTRTAANLRPFVAQIAADGANALMVSYAGGRNTNGTNLYSVALNAAGEVYMAGLAVEPSLNSSFAAAGESLPGRLRWR